MIKGSHKHHHRRCSHGGLMVETLVPNQVDTEEAKDEAEKVLEDQGTGKQARTADPAVSSTTSEQGPPLVLHLPAKCRLW